MTVLENVKELLGNPEGADDKLDVIVTLTKSRLLNLLGTEKIPSELMYIATEVSVIRFNRVGSEGANSHSVEGESLTFKDDDFAEYLGDIEKWKNRKNGVTGVVKFL